MLDPDFLAGVVEGFYGQMWTHQQRLHLFGQMGELGLTTYFYAPKNDLKHRTSWRELYSDSELLLFRELVQSCDAHKVRFIYGLSPGLDIGFAEEAERNRIKSRFDQLRKVGAHHFALLFDDLPGKMSDDDRRAYPSLAAAQCDVANDVFAWVRAQYAGARFLFCPTPYCDRMDRAQHGGPGYLDEVGRLLSSEVDVLWTGPEIVSAEISTEWVERLSHRIRRSPLIWDNLFANDYDFHRVYCGPYSGRPRDLRRAVRGILINPNNEYPLNFIPLRTFAAFLHGNGEWKPRDFFLNAAAEWLPAFDSVTGPLTLDDMILLADCFYLPHEEGPKAQALFDLCNRLFTDPVESWGDAYEQFSGMNARIQALFDRLTELRDRDLFDAWSRRVWALKEELLIIDAALAQKKASRDIVEGIELEICLPGTFRGGTLAKLERFLSIDGHGKVRTQTTL
jgi:hypothetical protein